MGAAAVDRAAVATAGEDLLTPAWVTAWLAIATPAPTIVEPTEPVVVAPQRDAPARTPRKLVFAFMPALSFGVSPVPSLDLPFFLGGRLRGRPWALGYQFTLSSGLAERYTFGIVTHRHHLTAMRRFGAGDRGFTSAGGGVAFLLVVPVVEAEGRIGWSFGQRKRGLFGLVARLGWNVGYGERAPLPQLGLVLGIATL